MFHFVVSLPSLGKIFCRHFFNLTHLLFHSGLLCEILTLVIGLLFELKVELAFLLKGYAGHCGYAHWGNLLDILGIVLKV